MQEPTIKQCIENIKKIKASIKALDGIVTDTIIEKMQDEVYEYGLMICDLRQVRDEEFVAHINKIVE